MRPEEQGVAEVLQDWAGSSRIFRPAMNAGEGPGRSTGYETDGIVLMGSAVSVHDELPWLAALSSWLRPILDGEVGVPLLGICFGHQLIAHLGGGKVGWVSEDHRKRVGVSESSLAGGRLLPGNHALSVVVSHNEEVQQVPPGFRVCATRDDIAIDGLEHERHPVFSFQFHPEAREEFAVNAGIPPERIDARVRDDGQRVLGAFRDRVIRTGSDHALSDRPIG
jgi:GMP synthase-like glutamine amidotransferase